jgi:hypothetical protein
VAEMMPKPIDAKTQADIDYRNAQIDKINWEMNRPNAGKEKSTADKKFDQEQALATAEAMFPGWAGGSIMVPKNQAKQARQALMELGFNVPDPVPVEDDRGILNRAYDSTFGSAPEEMVELRRGGWDLPQRGGGTQPQGNPGATAAPGPAPIEGAQWMKKPKTDEWGWHIKDPKTGQWAIVNTGGAEEPPPSTGGAPTFGPENLLRPGGGQAGEDERVTRQEEEVPDEVETQDAHGVPVVITDRGYMVKGEDGLRPPTAEEMKKIQLAARQGKIKRSPGWQYKTKFPGSGSAAWDIGTGGLPTLPNLSGRQ